MTRFCEAINVVGVCSPLASDHPKRAHCNNSVTSKPWTKSDDERVRLGAIQAALDRGWGKPTQHTEADVSVYDRLGLAEQQALLAALDTLDVEDEDEVQVTPPSAH